MRRREFIKMVGGATAWPGAARADITGKLTTIGFLGSATAATQSQLLAAFAQRLHELGWIPGRNVAIEVRWGEGRNERFTAIAEEFARLKADVIFAPSTAAVVAAKRATSAIPIVFAVAADPVGSGLVANLARPAGMITGLSVQSVDVAGKRVQLLREVVPDLHRLAIMANIGSPGSSREMREVQAAASSLGVEVMNLEIQRAQDISSAFEAIAGRVEALYIAPEPLVGTNQARINSLAISARLPTMHGVREFVEAGGLMSYGANFADLFRRAGDYVDKILRGAKPSDLPVQQPTKFELVINLRTAKALGLTIPESFLLRADEVIE